MNLGQRTVAQLSRLRHPSRKAPTAVEARAGFGYIHEEMVNGIQLKVEVQDVDKYGYLVRQITLDNKSPLEKSADVKAVLMEQAKAIEARISYLLEDMHLVEFHAPANQAQVRSVIPYRQDRTIHYYEILLSGGTHLSFSRYSKPAGSSERAPEASYLTDETLARLTNDLATILQLN